MNFNDPDFISENIIHNNITKFICFNCLEDSNFKTKDILRIPRKTKTLPQCAKCFNNKKGICQGSPVGDKLGGLHPDFVPFAHRCIFGKKQKDGECMSMSELCCPICKSKIYKTVGKVILISIVGLRDSGKSHYIGVLLHEIMNDFGKKFGWLVQEEETTSENYKANYSSLYDAVPKILGMTGTNDSGVYEPYIYYISFADRQFTLVFFDTAGEDFESYEKISVSAKHIFQADGIIFILDPLKLPALASLADAGAAKDSSHSKEKSEFDSNFLTSRMSEIIRQHKGLSSRQAIAIPLAVTFSKLDVIASNFPSYGSVTNGSKYRLDGKYTEAERIRVNNEILNFIKKTNNMGLKEMLNQIDYSYSNYSFFAVSALGLRNHPVGGKIRRPQPHRVEDPLLWILYKNNII